MTKAIVAVIVFNMGLDLAIKLFRIQCHISFDLFYVLVHWKQTSGFLKKQYTFFLQKPMKFLNAPQGLLLSKVIYSQE